jgi:hypothetical protein
MAQSGNLGARLGAVSAFFPARVGHKVRAACQFRARGSMKGWLTVNVPVVSRQGLGTSAAMSPMELPMERETAGERGFRSIPALSRAFDADEELAADALKEQGNRSLRCGTCAGGVCRRGRVAEYRRLSSIAAAHPSPSTTV